MIGQKDLQTLIGFDGEGLVLSVYLDTDLSQQPKEQVKLYLRRRLEEVADKSLAKDVRAIETYIDYEFDWQARGLALFSAERAGLWQAYPLSVSVRNLVFVAEQPYIKPLSDLLDENRPQSVVILDRERARLLTVRGGAIDEGYPVEGEEVSHHKQGGWSQSALQRQTEQQVLRNIRAAAEATVGYCKKNDCDGLILAGTDEIQALFKEQLPRQMQDRILGAISADMATPSAQVLDRALDVIREARERRAHELVQKVLSATAAGGLGVTGLPDTLYAIREGRVHELLIERGYESPGALCGNCGYVSPLQGQPCLFCRSDMDALGNAVDLAAQKAIESGARVHIIDEDQALADAGHIGAILRY